MEGLLPRDQAYLDLLHHGLVTVRNLAAGGEMVLCRIEADHLHNIPRLLGKTDEQQHLYYIEKERGLYLQRMRQVGATAILEAQMIWYAVPWRVLAAEAGIELER